MFSPLWGPHKRMLPMRGMNALLNGNPFIFSDLLEDSIVRDLGTLKVLRYTVLLMPFQLETLLGETYLKFV